MKQKIRKKSFFSIHYSFIFLMIFSCFLGLTRIIVLYFICLLLHELCHAIVAKNRGYKIGKIKLLMTGAVLEADGDEFSFKDEILIAGSGPCFNLCFSILLLSVWWIIPESYNYTQDLLVINLAIFFFNMLPIFPLDGGRILLAILSLKKERSVAVSIVKTVACIISLLMFLIFIISCFNIPAFSLGISSVTLFIGAITEDKDASYKRVFYLSRKKERMDKRGVEARVVYVKENMTKLQLIKLLNARYYTVFVKVNEEFKMVETIQEADLFENK